MHPIICKIGPLTIYSYGLMLAFTFLLVSFLAKKEGERQGVNGAQIIDLTLYLVISGIIGSRAFYVLLNF